MIRFPSLPSARLAGAAWIAAIYLMVGTVWITFSDAVAAWLVTDPPTLLQVSVLKGWAFMAVTTTLLVLLILNHTRALADSQRRSHRLARYYRTLSESNHALIRSDSEEDFLASVCEALQALDPFRVVWIGMHESAKDAIVPVAAIGPAADSILRQGAFPLHSHTSLESADELSLPARAFLQGALQVETEPADLDAPAGQDGIMPPAAGSSACCVPISRDGRVVGVLGLGSPRPDHFNMELVGFLQELGDEISFGLDSLQRSASLRRAVADLERATTEARHLNAELESRVADRTAQLNEINSELEAFVFSVSHDLRAPLRAIDGFTLILQEETRVLPGSPGGRAMAIILSETRRMAQLIDSLLALSRLGRAAVQIQHVDMRELVSSAWEELTSGDPNNHTRLVIGDLPAASGDRNLLRQVWVNLLSNARKFSGRSVEPVVTVAGHIAENQTVYTVADNGVGFDMQKSDHLFRVFQRLHSPTDFEGTGAGLAIVQRIVHRHGGTITAVSAPGQGATFTFALPLQSEC